MGFGKGDFGWDLPPGVRECDIPGNRPEDIEYEKLMESHVYPWLEEKDHLELAEILAIDVADLFLKTVDEVREDLEEKVIDKLFSSCSDIVEFFGIE